MPLTPLPPVDTRAFFRPVASALVDLLRAQPPEAFDRPTVAGAWRVRDVLAHLVDITLRRVSFQRDAHTPPAPDPMPRSEREFVAFINGLNAEWVQASKRLSPRVLVDSYERAAAALAEFVESLPLDAPALFPVSWAGEAQSAGWFDLGREFTEQWHHQMQIRDAVGATPLDNPAWLRAVLEIGLRALPHAYRDTRAEVGQSILLEITGPAGGHWMLRRGEAAWQLGIDTEPLDVPASAVVADLPRPASNANVATRIRLSDDTAWRLWFNALSKEWLETLISIDGNAALAQPLLGARSVVV